MNARNYFLLVYTPGASIWTEVFKGVFPSYEAASAAHKLRPDKDTPADIMLFDAEGRWQVVGHSPFDFDPFYMQSEAAKRFRKRNDPILLEENETKAEYAVFVTLQKCSHCQHPMYKNPIDWNATDANMRKIGTITVNSKFMTVCSVCADEHNRSTVTCNLCRKERTINQIQEDVGRAHFCVSCYESVSASDWHDALSAAEDSDEY